MIFNRPHVLGVEITPGSRASLLESIRQHLISSDEVLHVVTANPEYIMTAREDARFAQAINDAGIVTVDGAGLAVAMRLLHPRITSERYTGVMLVPDMVQLSAETGEGVFLLGAGPGVADRAAEVMLADHPGGRIVGTWSEGSPRPADDTGTMHRIRESGARIVLVAYGAPAQIHWIERNLPALHDAGVRVVAGIGGAFDYISGTVALPSPIVRKLGLEWLVRLVREPWRWRRQLVLPHFGLLVLVEAGRARLRGGVE